ncbi:angiotensin-converting enzyme-like protein Ace3, partial [Convolutriloba macropyga]|uniref:angiotensin-converting enzyme-like protein Ace3 n=1 Tax=Convolutriloba macropyga TaxID=536237 RepID=UPI003F526710
MVAGDLVISDPDDFSRKAELESSMQEIYEQSLMNITVVNHYYNLTQQPGMLYLIKEDLEREPLWKSVWYAFRDQHAPKLRPILIERRNLMNKWAVNTGRAHAPEVWLEKFEIGLDEYREIMDKIANDFMGLYEKIHAYVRHKLRQLYPGLIDENGLIPSHLTEDIWAQYWDRLIDKVEPHA